MREGLRRWLWRRLQLECPNHPYWKAFDGEPGTHWAPAVPCVCVLFDWLSDGLAHD